MRNLGLSLLLLVCTLLASSNALAHTLTFSVYSKYEATTSGKRLAVVYALEKNATLNLIREQVAHQSVGIDELPKYEEFFTNYFFERLIVANNGLICEHPERLHHFGWDKKTSRVLAATTFTCTEDLDDLLIRSAVTHDMPTSHSTMGDLAHGLALVRHRFLEDEVEVQELLSRLPQTHRTYPKRKRRRARLSYVAEPDTKRRYDYLVQEMLGSADADGASPAKPEAPPSEQVDEPEPPESFGSIFLAFFGEGVWHIWIGYDHILFILTLILTIRTWTQLGVIVTSFTLAHSLTLVGATLGIITLAQPVIEPVIALSVLYVAVEALVRPRSTARPGVTFGFGLVHGFGLSGVLLDLGLRDSALASALFGFNVGVEIGQLAIVAPIFPLVLRLWKHERWYLRTRRIVCVLVAILAAYWSYTRIVENFG